MEADPQPAPAASRFSSPASGSRNQFWCFVLTWLALLAAGTIDQFFDAGAYTSNALTILDGNVAPGGFAPRGALTALIYLPAALVSQWGLSLNEAVLAQNAALLAAVGAFLLPALVSRVGVQSRQRAIWCCTLVVIICGRFANAGLMDIWAMSAFLLAVTLVARPTVGRVLAAGVLVGAAVNLRPAYLLPALLLLVMWGIWIRRHWAWLAIGSVMAVVPQGLMELFRPGSFRLWYDGMGDINQIQLRYAAWVVRYDTVPSSSAPQQFFCEPDMAAMQQDAITSPVALAGHLLTHLPQSADLVLQKMTAWLMWTWSTPYLERFDPYVSQLSVLVVLVVVLGTFGWVQAIGRREVPLTVVVSVLALTIGILVGVVASTPESRFAIMLVALGIAGVVQVRFAAMSARQIGGVVAVIAVVLVMGMRGLDHPAPPGNVEPENCAQPSEVPTS